MSLVTVEGVNGIKATILADSISPHGIRFTTMECEYPRIILAELNTHRMLSKNSHSSRAIPFQKMVEQLNGRPVRFGQANPGMQDKGEDFDGIFPVYCPVHGDIYMTPEQAWTEARYRAIGMSQAMFNGGLHKQVYNRLTEPFQMMRTVVSATEWENFFWLRDDDAADPTLHELARVMRLARAQSTPQALNPGEWHLPYVETFRDDSGGIMYRVGEWDEPGTSYGFVGLEDARKVSAARCAAVSFRNLDYGLDKCLEVYDRLVGDERKHASAFEHQATPMEASGPDLCGCCDINVPTEPWTWEEGVTHMDRHMNLWSGNLRGFVQFRKLIPGENMEG